ncbi:DNA rep factor C sub [Enterospora canceri]|uniref:DNA rep factor C sub n=1 Tax=Enterospora canceri TaxID=1081671 RepID=A0A1Y1SA72_9MICR|nr:DNA rep factor C sub [Enterospora canceri]
MLWTRKYAPNDLNNFKTHNEVVSVFRSFTIDTVPNLVIYGSSGSNKKTLVYALARKMYGKELELRRVNHEIQINSTKIEISYMESNEVIVINPSAYKNRDRVVVQHIIKKAAESRPITSFFSSRLKGHRLIIIEQAENLSKDAQAALRITMEQYSSHFKIFMICSGINTIIEPIKSRNLFIRCRKFKNEEIKEILKEIAEKEQVTIDEEIASQIAENAQGDCKRAISVLELHTVINQSSVGKRSKLDLTNFKLAWEEKLEKVVKMIREGKVENLVKIRDELYDVVVQNIDPLLIMQTIHRFLENHCIKAKSESIDLLLKYQERIKLGTKPLFHIEAYVANMMYVISRN